MLWWGFFVSSFSPNTLLQRLSHLQEHPGQVRLKAGVNIYHIRENVALNTTNSKAGLFNDGLF
jgi:hypothetical protein